MRVSVVSVALLVSLVAVPLAANPEPWWIRMPQSPPSPPAPSRTTPASPSRSTSSSISRSSSRSVSHSTSRSSSRSSSTSTRRSTSRSRSTSTSHSSSTSTSTSAAATATACPLGIRPRREIKDVISRGEFPAFAAAVRTLQSGSSPTAYDRIVNQHLTWQLDTHNYPPFFVWHRVYLREVEKQLQAVDPSVMIPYWQWSIDASAPAMSSVFGTQYMGGNGQGSRNCIADGVFANYQAAYPTRHCSNRQWDNGDSISAWHSVEAMNNFVGISNTYDALRTNIEYTPHGAWHVSIGADMATMASPNDVLFFLHHGYMDKIWSDWQIRFPNLATNYGGTLRSGATARATDPQQPWTTTANQVFNTRNLCYYYEQPTASRLSRRQDVVSDLISVPTQPLADTLNTVNTAVTGSSTGSVLEIRNLEVPAPIPDDYMIRMGYSAAARAHVRQQEATVKDIVEQLNNLDGYISPSSLYRRHDLLEEYIRRHGGDITTATINHKQIPLQIDATRASSAKQITTDLIASAKNVLSVATNTSSVVASGRLGAASVTSDKQDKLSQLKQIIGEITDTSAFSPIFGFDP